MNAETRCLTLALAALATWPTARTFSQTAVDGPYKIVNTAQEMGNGGIDYVTTDSAGRRLYVPRGGQVLVFDLDTLKSVGSITNARGVHGVALDPTSAHGFSSSNPVLMWDTKTLATLKSIDVQGRPDGIIFEPLTGRIFVLSHAQPNATVIDGKDGSIVGTIDLGGAPEQAASDGQGHLYVDIEDQDKVAVVDVKTLKVTANYDLSSKAKTPAGLALDVKNQVLFAFCRNPATAVMLSAVDGKILASLPIGSGTDGGGFIPETLEAFSSQGDGTLSIIKETGPTTFELEQTLKTKSRAKTCALDSKKNQIIVITTEPTPALPTATPPPAAPPTTGAEQPGTRRGGRGGGGGPGLLDILVIGR